MASPASAAAGSTVRTLRTVVFMGSAKTVAPPWGGDARLGDRVLKYVEATLAARESRLGPDTVRHAVSIIDPVEVFGPDGALSEISSAALSAPTFFFRELPPRAAALRDIVAAADCYVIVSPEYNHVVPPALASVMGHFGGSCYKAKPSGVVTYSPGPWGGQRAALSIVSMAHELGCLPVSKMVGLPAPAELLREDGAPHDPEHRMLKQLPEMLAQLEWMAVAMKNQRDAVGTF